MVSIHSRQNSIAQTGPYSTCTLVPTYVLCSAAISASLAVNPFLPSDAVTSSSSSYSTIYAVHCTLLLGLRSLPRSCIAICPGRKLYIFIYEYGVRSGPHKEQTMCTVGKKRRRRRRSEGGRRCLQFNFPSSTSISRASSSLSLFSFPRSPTQKCPHFSSQHSIYGVVCIFPSDTIVYPPPPPQITCE